MTPFYAESRVTLYLGECVDVLRAAVPDASVEAVVTDPPYGLEFMGQEWDAIGRYGVSAKNPRCMQCGRLRWDHAERKCACSAPMFHARATEYAIAMQEWHHAWLVHAFRVLKPGGHLLAFGGTRTYHRLTCALEDAGFEIRDCLMWLYGSGFPKSLDVSKAIDKAAGATREIIARRTDRAATPKQDIRGGRLIGGENGAYDGSAITAPATAYAVRWSGWGTALKPAHEPIVLARKPLAERNVAANVVKHGTGALNIDGGRIAGAFKSGWSDSGSKASPNRAMSGPNTARPPVLDNPAGRWPANVILSHAAGCVDGCPVAMLDAQSNGDGGASRFFYTAKADSTERDGSRHPTVKPVDLMAYLIRLVTPPGGLVLDPFCGSGPTIWAAREYDFRAIGIDRERAYLDDTVRRLRQGVLW